MIDTTYCDIHDTAMDERVGKYGTFYSHRLKDGTWCNGKEKGASKPATPPKTDDFVKSLGESPVDWAAKDRQSLAQTAMKAASEVLAAMIKAGYGIEQDEVDSELKRMANEYYGELKKMKGED